jgi:hypothetical protein
MADLKPEKRAEVARMLHTPCNFSNHELREAPNEKMPNEREFDFRCQCGRLYNLTDVLQDGDD